MIESLDDDRNVDRIEDPEPLLTFGMLRGHMSDMKALPRPGLIPPTPPPNSPVVDLQKMAQLITSYFPHKNI